MREHDKKCQAKLAAVVEEAGGDEGKVQYNSNEGRKLVQFLGTLLDADEELGPLRQVDSMCTQFVFYIFFSIIFLCVCLCLCEISDICTDVVSTQNCVKFVLLLSLLLKIHSCPFVLLQSDRAETAKYWFRHVKNKYRANKKNNAARLSVYMYNRWQRRNALGGSKGAAKALFRGALKQMGVSNISNALLEAVAM